ncbi:Unconventional myosin-XV [Manis javanica]|nr:Unconventional myosin-XV [Manis javanica]
MTPDRRQGAVPHRLQTSSTPSTAQPAWAKRLHRRQQLTHAATTAAHTLRGGDCGSSSQGPSLRIPIPDLQGELHAIQTTAGALRRYATACYPYQSAAQVWDERIGSARVQARNWRFMAFGCLTGRADGGRPVWRSAQSIVTPYVIEVDNAGQVRAVGEAATPYKPSDAQIAYHLGRFIGLVRSLSIDPIVVRQNWLDAYDYTTDKGAVVLNEYARTNDPFARIGKESGKPPPTISLDEPVQAQPLPEPPKPVEVVTVPQPLALPSQLKPLPETEEAKPAPEPADEKVRVSRANAEARVAPTREGYVNAIQVWPFTDGALYQLYAAVGRVTVVSLQPGEELVTVAAGDTVRWIVGDTSSGSGEALRVNVMVKPIRSGLKTNLVITTSRRTYLLELTSTEKTWMASVSWEYPKDKMLALQRQAQAASAAARSIAASAPARHGEQTELYNVDRVSKSEGLDGLPADYSKLPPKVPELGPPLPGDLGPAIVKSQQPVTPAYAQPGHDPADAWRKEADAAANSSVFSARATKARPPRRSRRKPRGCARRALAGFDPLAAGPASTAAQPSDPTAVQNRQDQKEAFLKGGSTETRNSGNLQMPASPYQVMAGTVIAGALVTGIKSDLPGDVIATVTEPVYDTATGKFLLIPQGSRILGKYNSQVSYGQSRVQVVWNRVILPDTSSLKLDNLAGTDPAGYSGLEDGVDWHWDRVFAGAALTTLLGVGAELAAPGKPAGWQPHRDRWAR